MYTIIGTRVNRHTNYYYYYSYNFVRIFVYGVFVLRSESVDESPESDFEGDSDFSQNNKFTSLATNPINRGGVVVFFFFFSPNICPRQSIN